jgi:hypothetical protein
MKRTILMAMVFAAAACGPAEEFGSSPPRPLAGEPIEWTTSATGVDCNGTPARQARYTLPWDNLDGDEWVAWYPATWPYAENDPAHPKPDDWEPGGADSGDLEETLYCSWNCALWDGGTRARWVTAFFKYRDGAWVEALVVDGPANCW